MMESLMVIYQKQSDKLPTYSDPIYHHTELCSPIDICFPPKVSMLVALWMKGGGGGSKLRHIFGKICTLIIYNVIFIKCY